MDCMAQVLRQPGGAFMASPRPLREQPAALALKAGALVGVASTLMRLPPLALQSLSMASAARLQGEGLQELPPRPQDLLLVYLPAVTLQRVAGCTDTRFQVRGDLWELWERA